MLRRLLRSLGIALILLPEPFTTPFGLALVGSSFIVARSQRVDSHKRLREFIKFYLNYARPFGYTGKIIHHTLNQRLFRQYGDSSCGLETDQYYDCLGKSRAPEKVVHHTINDRWPLLRYGARAGGSEAGQDYGWPIESRAVERVIHHTINDRWPLLRYGARAGGSEAGQDYGWLYKFRAPEKVIYHTIDDKKLLLNHGNLATTLQPALSAMSYN